MTVTLTQALIGLGSLGALLAIVYGPWQAICTDIARQIVFEKRDAIFDLAQSGKLSFSSREYGTIRSSLQASIRFAHELTLPRFLVMAAVLFARGTRRPEDTDLSRAIREIADPTIRQQVEGLVSQAHRTLIAMMLAKSPMMMLVFLPSLLIFALIALPRFRDAAHAMERRAGGFVQLEADAVPS